MWCEKNSWLTVLWNPGIFLFKMNRVTIELFSVTFFLLCLVFFCFFFEGPQKSSAQITFKVHLVLTDKYSLFQKSRTQVKNLSTHPQLQWNSTGDIWVVIVDLRYQQYLFVVQKCYIFHISLTSFSLWLIQTVVLMDGRVFFLKKLYIIMLLFLTTVISESDAVSDIKCMK